jgi:hypothetical protein
MVYIAQTSLLAIPFPFPLSPLHSETLQYLTLSHVLIGTKSRENFESRSCSYTTTYSSTTTPTSLLSTWRIREVKGALTSSLYNTAQHDAS